MESMRFSRRRQLRIKRDGMAEEPTALKKVTFSRMVAL
jgi:hypothetical protein